MLTQEQHALLTGVATIRIYPLPLSRYTRVNSLPAERKYKLIRKGQNIAIALMMLAMVCVGALIHLIPHWYGIAPAILLSTIPAGLPLWAQWRLDRGDIEHPEGERQYEHRA